MNLIMELRNYRPLGRKIRLVWRRIQNCSAENTFLSDSSGRWHMWDENKKRNIGPAIEDKEELKNPRLPIIDIKLVGGKDWIAEIEIRKYYAPASTTRVFYDDQDKAIGVESSRETSERIEKEKGIVYYISPLFKKIILMR